MCSASASVDIICPAYGEASFDVTVGPPNRFLALNGLEASRVAGWQAGSTYATALPGWAPSARGSINVTVWSADAPVQRYP